MFDGSVSFQPVPAVRTFACELFTVAANLGLLDQRRVVKQGVTKISQRKKTNFGNIIRSILKVLVIRHRWVYQLELINRLLASRFYPNLM
jgi:hypothetical protein